MSEIGRKLAALRTRAGLDKTQMADRLGVSGHIYGFFEAEALVPKLEILLNIERDFDVTLQWLIDESDGATREYAELHSIMSVVRERLLDWEFRSDHWWDAPEDEKVAVRQSGEALARLGGARCMDAVVRGEFVGHPQRALYARLVLGHLWQGIGGWDVAQGSSAR